MRLPIHAAGELMLLVANDHDAPEPQNEVQIMLHRSDGSKTLLERIGRLSSKRVFAQVKEGDEVEISEVYAKIRVDDVLLSCTGQLQLAKVGQPVACKVGQRVRVKENGHPIGHGEIETVVGSNEAVVAFVRSGTNPRLRFHWESFAAHDVSLDDDGGADGNTDTQCSSFEASGSKVGLVIVADAQFRNSYELQIDSLRCFASKHNYDLWMLKRTSYSACDKYKDFFFKKHCMVSHLLSERPADYTVVVVDADVVGVNLERGLNDWVSAGTDLQFYEREMTHEIAAGNYIARNTAFARSFLMGWADFELNGRRGPGYSSADNGAIHIHLVESLGLGGSASCSTLYHALKHDVTDLSEYFRFVKCTMDLLGGPKTWRLDGGKQVKIWGERNFFVADAMTVNYKVSASSGPVMHHGVKKRADVLATYYSDVENCVVKSTVEV